MINHLLKDERTVDTHNPGFVKLLDLNGILAMYYKNVYQNKIYIQ